MVTNAVIVSFRTVDLAIRAKVCLHPNFIRHNTELCYQKSMGFPNTTYFPRNARYFLIHHDSHGCASARYIRGICCLDRKLTPVSICRKLSKRCCRASIIPAGLQNFNQKMHVEVSKRQLPLSCSVSVVFIRTVDLRHLDEFGCASDGSEFFPTLRFSPGKRKHGYLSLPTRC